MTSLFVLFIAIYGGEPEFGLVVPSRLRMSAMSMGSHCQVDRCWETSQRKLQNCQDPPASH